MIASSLAPPAAPEAQTMLATPQSRRAVPTAGTVALALRIAILAFAGVLLVGAIAHFALAGRARVWLGYQFPELPARSDVAAGIFVHNTRAILGVFGLLLVAQLAARSPQGPARAQRLILTTGELILTAMIAANVLVLGAGLGAYGERMARGTCPTARSSSPPTRPQSPCTCKAAGAPCPPVA